MPRKPLEDSPKGLPPRISLMTRSEEWIKSRRELLEPKHDGRLVNNRPRKSKCYPPSPPVIPKMGTAKPKLETQPTHSAPSIRVIRQGPTTLKPNPVKTTRKMKMAHPISYHRALSNFSDEAAVIAQRSPEKLMKEVRLEKLQEMPGDDGISIICLDEDLSSLEELDDEQSRIVTLPPAHMGLQDPSPVLDARFEYSPTSPLNGTLRKAVITIETAYIKHKQTLFSNLSEHPSPKCQPSLGGPISPKAIEAPPRVSEPTLGSMDFMGDVSDLWNNLASGLAW